MQIGAEVKPPTIREFLTEMAAQQRDEIRRLKAEASGGKLPARSSEASSPDKLLPDAWQLHPVKVTRTKLKKSARGSKRSSTSRKKPLH